jgi:Protein of unknown function (DUF2442)
VKKELRSSFARASRAGQRAAKTEPRAARDAYHAKNHALRIELTNGAWITIPVELIPSLKRAAPGDLRSVEVLGRGGGLHWERLDFDLSVPALVLSMFAGPSWMAEWDASAAAARRRRREPQHVETDVEAVARAFDRRRYPEDGLRPARQLPSLS